MFEVDYIGEDQVTYVDDHKTEFDEYKPMYGYMSRDEVVALQFTGIKDKNSVLVFEKDIVKQSYRNGFAFYEIIHHEHSIVAKFRDDMKYDYVIGLSEHGDFKGITLSSLSGCTIEVIGNIYENPELLKTEGV